MALLIFFSGCRLPVPIPIDKSIQAQASFWEYFRIFQQDKPDLFPIPSCYIRTVSYHHIQDQLPYTRKDGKENTEEEDEMLKEHTSGCPGTFAVVTSAVRGTTQSLCCCCTC